jgi:hypothetical protein
MVVLVGDRRVEQRKIQMGVPLSLEIQEDAWNKFEPRNTMIAGTIRLAKRTDLSG